MRLECQKRTKKFYPRDFSNFLRSALRLFSRESISSITSSYFSSLPARGTSSSVSITQGHLVSKTLQNVAECAHFHLLLLDTCSGHFGYEAKDPARLSIILKSSDP